MSVTAETIAELWRMSREEAKEVQARVAMLERAVMRAMTGAAVPGSDEDWAVALCEVELWLERAIANTARIAGLLEGRGR